MRQYPDDLGVPKEFKQNSSLFPALRDDNLEPSISSFVDLLWSASITKERGESMFFTADRVKFLREIVWVCKTY